MKMRKDQEHEERRQQIIDGALDVFARKGFEKATNKDIARASGIRSPGLIYHYFADKADLFQHVIQQRMPALQLIAYPEKIMPLPPTEALPLLGNAFLKIVESRTTMAVLKLMLGEAARQPTVADMVNSIGPGRVFPVLTSYMSQQMEAGTLRHMDPGAAARCFVGPLIGYIITHELFPQQDTHTLTPETMVQTAVEIFLHGMAIPSEE